ncbi:DEAD/DEAH box helicase family protein [Bradyrhizobium sp. 35]|uniref:DEAD/DEAH box helicase n=1 Tax=Bradyrhizobium sp. 35 TaxID=2782670 RepID=UPI001FFB7FE8|nr:DEAD/DEAH box helicase family protein [Bradyrhizobium sp. 35]MCK1449598.1 DEAD/DEAH box helicase family protein [Bradyrhizobium sp. 35]
MFALKNYQVATLAVLKSYLEAARTIGARRAFDEIERIGVKESRKYRPLEGLEPVPYVCLRLPTGGGKTLLSAHTAKIAADTYLEREFPIVLWLVPTNTIRSQTLETLKKPGNPNYEALNAAFEGKVRVLDIADFAQLTPTDLQTHLCVIVGTMQTLRVSNTEGRKVYAHNENLEPHFSSIPTTAPGLERIEEGDHKGQIKFSFRNLLAWHRPLVIVDEAHNNTSSLSYEVLQRVNAACVVEFTATPANDSNVLHNVSATELKAEEMIKLPIRLVEHKSWEDAVRDSILTRQRLHDLASKDRDYIRPIILFQAEEKGKEVTKEVLLKHLLEQEKIPRDKIAVVTGDQKELDGINLFARDCPIDFVITVEALKEGWDCSFAYVFCSAASVQSKKDVEQILGRVLRMPYAKRRNEPDLNRAYAHVSRASWPNAVKQLHDRLVDMGFEDGEADGFIEKVPDLGLTGGANGPLFALTPPPTIIDLNEDISELTLSPDERAGITIERTEQGSRVTFTGSIDASAVSRLVSGVKSAEVRGTLELEAKRHIAVWQVHSSPAQRGVPFTVPQLCFDFDGALELAEQDAFLEARGWSLLDYSAELSVADFALTESGVQWEIDLNVTGRITEKAIGKADQYDLDLVDIGWTQNELGRWLERKIRQPDITQPVLLEFVRRALTYLVENRGLPLTALARWKFILAKVLVQKICQHRENASSDRYQRVLFSAEAAVETSFDFEFDFTPAGYAPHWLYVGHPYQFQKHYYPSIGELENKGEEYECAKALDMTGKVKHWVRNLERRGFWLPLAKSKFYPDFVAELTDGRLLALEHKGKVYATNDDSKEKCNIGELWEEKSNGKAIYLMTVLEKGKPGLFEQIAAKIG